MPEDAGYYQKYQVERTDGQPIEGRTFTLEVDRDPFALAALKAYRDQAVLKGMPALAAGLDELIADIQDSPDA